jgi:amidase
MTRITRDHITYVLSRDLPPVVTIAPGEVVIFETLDAASGKLKTLEDALTIFAPKEQANPATGPVSIRGAEPGDNLVVTVLDIQLGERGHTRIRRGAGVITDELNPPRALLIPVRDGVVHFTDRIRFPARPMVGVIGTAPAGAPVPTFFPGPHGGNMDQNDVAPGAKVHLPVGVGGALLCIGDVHASMGDGELTGGGIDIRAEVTVRVQLEKGQARSRPWIETGEAWMVCANAPELPAAIRQATSDMATFLAGRLRIDREEAFMLIAARGDLKLGQAAMLGMDATVRLSIPKVCLAP